MLYLNRLETVAEHLALDPTIGLRKTVMLPFVFGPRINLEGLEIDTGRLGIDEDSPAYRAIAAADALIFVDFTEKLGSFRWVDDIFHCDQDRPLVRGGLLNHGWFNPVIPNAEVYLRIRQWEQRPQQQAGGRSEAREGESRMDTRVQRHKAPEGASCGDASLKYEEI